MIRSLLRAVVALFQAQPKFKILTFVLAGSFVVLVLFFSSGGDTPPAPRSGGQTGSYNKSRKPAPPLPMQGWKKRGAGPKVPVVVEPSQQDGEDSFKTGGDDDFATIVEDDETIEDDKEKEK